MTSKEVVERLTEIPVTGKEKCFHCPKYSDSKGLGSWGKRRGNAYTFEEESLIQTEVRIRNNFRASTFMTRKGKYLLPFCFYSSESEVLTAY